MIPTFMPHSVLKESSPFFPGMYTLTSCVVGARPPPRLPSPRGHPNTIVTVCNQAVKTGGTPRTGAESIKTPALFTNLNIEIMHFNRG